MKLLIIDTETTGLKKDEGDKAIEVAAILFSVEHRAILQSISFLIPTYENGAAHINGIDPVITKEPQPWRTALALFQEMAAVADYLVAHNAAFDAQWFGHEELPELALPWLCTLSDFNWGDLPGRSLRDLALAHGIAVMPDIHRALPDCLLVAAVLAKRHDLEELIADACLPRAAYRAVITYAERERAKAKGFRWMPERKWWVKNLTGQEAAHLRIRDGLQLEKVAV